VDISSKCPEVALSRSNNTNTIVSSLRPVFVSIQIHISINLQTNPSKTHQTLSLPQTTKDVRYAALTFPIQPQTNTNSSLSDNANQQKTAKDVTGRENKGMGMADKLAGAVKDPINQTLGGNNQKSKGEDAEQNDTKGENIPGSSIPGKNY